MGSIEFARRELLINIIARYKSWSEPYDVNLMDKLKKLTNEQINETFERFKKENYGLLCYCAGEECNYVLYNSDGDMLNASFDGMNYVFEILGLETED